ncbi:hypothetical protein [Clostridium thermarum]|uniref:hypothetical protein n=1 Tax=Clostridium thermarum TaxID=1716543 RepID=UPI0013D58B8E|nr:hypothetical protein [Clostridium thermarum]
MNKYLMLEPKDVFQIANILKNIDNDNKSFMSPYMENIDLTEQSIRIAMFDYKEIYFGILEDERFINIACLRVYPNPPFKISSVELKLILNVNEFTKDFFVYIKNTVKNYFANISKISIYDNHKKTISDTLISLGFCKELTLDNEVGVGEDVDVYSSFII